VEIITDPPLYCVRFRSSSAGGLGVDALQRLDADKDAWAFDVIVIDPGHGGKDPGAVGPTRLYEKDVVLDVGLRLRKALMKHGIKIIMTRDKDIFIPLDERGRIANRAGGKLFISLHCNAIGGGKRAYGIETYFLAPAKTERAMRVALKENSVICFEESQDQYQDLTEENFILLTMAQSNFARESEHLAGMVQNKVSRGLSLPDRGVDQAGFYVLYGASMPAILVEMAFISTRSEEKKLRDKKFRQRLADYICKAVLNFSKQNG
ncbi:MAG: N-acetylmuramoyl-L-alanine amidase, partial [Calditrichaeota bacterium]|nr:N-acetylmuramoyl-L-alanine amidase [Calditrichota bacterium]